MAWEQARSRRSSHGLLICLLLLFQLRQGGERECPLVWPKRLQEALFDLRIQSQRTHPLTVCSSTLALVSAPPRLGPFALLTRGVPMEQRSTTPTA